MRTPEKSCATEASTAWQRRRGGLTGACCPSDHGPLQLALLFDEPMHEPQLMILALAFEGRPVGAAGRLLEHTPIGALGFEAKHGMVGAWWQILEQLHDSQAEEVGPLIEQIDTAALGTAVDLAADDTRVRPHHCEDA